MTTATVSSTAAHTPSRRGLRIALWIVQLLLAAAFLGAGCMKAFTPIAELGKSLPWALTVPAALVRFIGLSELLGAVGLVLPAVTRIKPGLTALAGAGLTLVMVLALLFHLSRGEGAAAGPAILLGGLSAFVAWGRFRLAPILPRG